jgi:hypothetical protein
VWRRLVTGKVPVRILGYCEDRPPTNKNIENNPMQSSQSRLPL